MVQVLESLQKNAMSSSTKPFPAESQYVASILAARAANGKAETGGDGSDSEEKGKTKKQKIKKPSKKPSKKPQKVEWKYSEIRNEFIKRMKSQGLSYSDAVKSWDDSLEKVKFLAPVSLPELRKRRFLEKGCNTNPWLERIESLATPAN